MPAEWERQRAVQLTWPHQDTDWCDMLDEITAVYREMAAEIAKREELIIVAPEKVQLSNINTQLAIIKSNDTWARDHGFITVVEDSHTILLDFKFNGWGEKFPADLDNAINRQLYELGMVEGTYEPHLDFVLEGGSIESDGKGTIFTTTSCLLAPHRNQPLKKSEIEHRLMQDLGARRVIWIEHGHLTGDDTDGHIDTLVRICPDDTLLYVGCDDTEDEQYEELHLMEQELQDLRTTDGRPYRLLKLPMPRQMYDNGQQTTDNGLWSAVSPLTGDNGLRLPATYANYLVINGAVLYPTYAQPDLDAEAARIIRQAYPDREIIGIDCRPVIRQHGSLHCCTMQYY